MRNRWAEVSVSLDGSCSLGAPHLFGGLTDGVQIIDEFARKCQGCGAEILTKVHDG